MHPSADTGRVIAGRYRLQAPIGRGAMGVVWRARDQLLDRDVAVKEVQIADTLTDGEQANAYQRTLREAKTAARLNHPAVVTVYDVCEDEGRPWIVMQLVSAQSLDQLLAASGPLPPQRAAEMGRQLLSALSMAHAAGVLHRDVKPSNVLLGRDDRAVLTDFGIATFAGDPRLTQTGMVMGSPGFTAPERIRGEDATPASDLWSLGATLFAAVEGHGPFERRGGAITTMSAIINEDAPQAPTAGALGPVIAALLRREPADRPDASEAARMITGVLPMLPRPGQLVSAQPGTGQPGTAQPGAGQPGETSDLASAEQTIAPTAPQPVRGPAPRYEQPPRPDFSSWYEPARRWGPPYQAPPGDGPSRRRRPGLGWKAAAVGLALIGAAAGAATVVLFRHDHSGAQTTRSTTAPAAGVTLPPTALVNAIDQPLTGPPPAGYRSYPQPASGSEHAGFRVDLPDRWTASRSGAYATYLSDPGKAVNMVVDLTRHTDPDMVREAQYIEAASVPRFPGYRRLGLRALTIRGTPGAFWKFTWQDSGVSQTALDLLFILDTSSGQQSYALYATAPSSMWQQMQPVFDEELRSFAPLPG